MIIIFSLLWQREFGVRVHILLLMLTSVIYRKSVLPHPTPGTNRLEISTQSVLNLFLSWPYWPFLYAPKAPNSICNQSHIRLSPQLLTCHTKAQRSVVLIPEY